MAVRRGPVVVETKIHVPAPPAGLVPRHALVGLLAGGLGRKVTLVSAPPGSGKTTLLAEWHAAAGVPFAWVSLDAADNDPVRFWTLVLAALRRVVPGVGGRFEVVLGSPGTNPADDAVPLLVNELWGVPGRAVLVLDDLHVVRDPEIHRSLAFLVERMPPSLHLVVATRSDPPLPLPRLRVRGELAELRSAELRFDDEQTATLLNVALELGLEPGDVARLQARTEGWPAALRLAGLSLRGHPDPHDFIASFAGDDRHIVDYLGAEVLDRLSDDDRAFLVRTSILERLGPSLCAAVTGEGDAGRRLEDLERGNVFVVSLDSRREWYRYHQLFAELLRRRLQLDEPDLVPELHRRASAWWAEHGFAEEAIHHALAGRDTSSAVDLVGARWSEFFNSGQLATVAGWLDALPRERVEADTRLWLARVWTALDTGRLDDVRPWLSSPTLEFGGEWRDLLRALYRFKSGDLPSAEEGRRWRDAAIRREGSSGFWRTVALCVAGVVLVWRGERSEARRALAEALERARADANTVAMSYVLGYDAMLDAQWGGAARAAASLGRASALAEEHPELDEHFTASMSHAAAALVSGDVDEAARAVELARRGAGRIELAYALRAAAVVGRDAALMAEARTAVAGCPDVGVLGELLGPARPPRAAAVPAAAGDELSEREREVLPLLATSLSQREIGRELYVSLNTVKSHVKSIFRKLDATSREEAVTRARELGLL